MNSPVYSFVNNRIIAFCHVLQGVYRSSNDAGFLKKKFIESYLDYWQVIDIVLIWMMQVLKKEGIYQVRMMSVLWKENSISSKNYENGSTFKYNSDRTFFFSIVSTIVCSFFMCSAATGSFWEKWWPHKSILNLTGL